MSAHISPLQRDDDDGAAIGELKRANQGNQVHVEPLEHHAQLEIKESKRNLYEIMCSWSSWRARGTSLTSCAVGVHGEQEEPL